MKVKNTDRCDKCRNEGVAWDYRPSLIDRDGFPDCYNKVRTCEICLDLIDSFWVLKKFKKQTIMGL